MNVKSQGDKTPPSVCGVCAVAVRLFLVDAERYELNILFNDKDTNTEHTSDFSLDRIGSLQATEKGEKVTQWLL